MALVTTPSRALDYGGMSIPREERGGVISTVKNKIAEALGSTRSRVDLFQADVEHRLFRLAAMIVWSIVAFVCLSLGVMFAMLTVIFGFDLPPKYALGIPAAVFLSVGAIAVLMFRVKKASKFNRDKHARGDN
jgi:hypothetical protein